MDAEMEALLQKKTWELTTLPPGKQALGCSWLYTIKSHPDGTIELKPDRTALVQRSGDNSLFLPSIPFFPLESL